MRKKLQRKRGSLAQELVAAVAQVGIWTGIFMAARGTACLFVPVPGNAVTSVSLFGMLSPVESAVYLLAGPVIGVASLAIRLHVTSRD